jgi:dihydroorotase
MCVHAVEPESPYGEILSHFGEGDILCHCFQSKGPHSILDANGKVLPAVREARSRGVIFDGASGRANYSFGVAQRALDDGFLPDVISTDVVVESIYKPKVFNLLYIMTGYLGLGMPLGEIIRAVTATPARLMGLEGKIGTLAPGAQADVAILKFREKQIEIPDQVGNVVKPDRLFLPMMTIKAGRTAYTRIDLRF